MLHLNDSKGSSDRSRTPKPKRALQGQNRSHPKSQGQENTTVSTPIVTPCVNSKRTPGRRRNVVRIDPDAIIGRASPYYHATPSRHKMRNGSLPSSSSPGVTCCVPAKSFLVGLRRRLRAKKKQSTLALEPRSTARDDETTCDWVTAKSTFSRKSTLEEACLLGTSLAGASTDDGEGLPETGESLAVQQSADRPDIPRGPINQDIDWGSLGNGKIEWPECTCAFPQHGLNGFTSEIPLVTPPGVTPGSYTEMLCHAKSLCGHWTTILARSQSLDPQMQHIGISRIKRSVMNKIAIPFSARLESNNTVLHAWITTPLGPKHMQCGLVGQTLTDVDSEVGTWEGVSRMVDFVVPWFCNGRPIRAIQIKRTSEVHGLAYETRVILPDKEEGKIMLFNIKLIPKEPTKEQIHVDRILKFNRPFTDKELEA